MERLRRLFNRAQLDRNELNIMRGILSAVQGRRGLKRRPVARMSATGGRPIYFDYAATTPVDPRVAARMAECLTPDGVFGNAGSSAHDYGEAANAYIEAARAEVAA